MLVTCVAGDTVGLHRDRQQSNFGEAFGKVVWQSRHNNRRRAWDWGTTYDVTAGDSANYTA
jgi:hypothetical protein